MPQQPKSPFPKGDFGSLLRITYELKPEIFDAKRGIAALRIKNFGFYFIFNPMAFIENYSWICK